MYDNYTQLPEDINAILKDIGENGNYNINNINDVKEICEVIKQLVISIYKTDKKFYPKKILHDEILQQMVYMYFKDKLSDNPYIFNESDEYKETLRNRVKILKDCPQPAQRTPEWYTYRNSRITASDSASVLNKNPYKTRDKFLQDKSFPENNFVKLSGDAIRHGVIFEDIVCKIYEKQESTKVTEYGCLPHSTISYLGASPDGIDDNGIMLEIKCPTGRKIYGLPPYVYWHQMQQQLEVADLNLCHFVECLIETISEETFKTFSDVDESQFYTGIIIEYYNSESGGLSYIYSNYGEKILDCNSWEEKHINSILTSDNLDYRNTIYWKLKTYSLYPIYRDRRWFNNVKPEFDTFWNQVIEKRDSSQPDSKSSSSRVSYKKTSVCLIESSDED